VKKRRLIHVLKRIAAICTMGIDSRLESGFAASFQLKRHAILATKLQIAILAEKPPKQIAIHAITVV
jgi:hypothetical protein